MNKTAHVSTHLEKAGPALGRGSPSSGSAHAPAFGQDRSLPVGNLEMQQYLRDGFIQASLQIGSPNDPLEREADAAAERCSRGTPCRPSAISCGGCKHQHVQLKPISASDRGLVASSTPHFPIQAKLSVSQPGDPSELEADRVAEVVASGNPFRSCTSGSCPGGGCSTCAHASGIHRKTQPGSAAAGGSRAVNRALGGGGHPLDPPVRASMERALGADFSAVRVHTDGPASESAQSIQALAYTAGRDVVFNAGQYAPDTGEGRKLLAHELAHVIQQTASSQSRIQRQGLDPESETAWGFLSGRSESEPQTFLGTVSAAPEAAQRLEQSITATGVPVTGEDRDALNDRLERLVRLNAIGLMASHRASVTEKREEMFAAPHPATATGAGGAGAPPTQPNPVAENARAIRAAAQQAIHLQTVKDTLNSSKSDLELASTAMLVRGASFHDTLDQMLEATRQYQGNAMGRYWGQVANSLTGQTRIQHDLAVALTFNMGRYLAQIRDQQISGIDTALYFLYDAFPFFGRLEPGDVPPANEATDEQLMSRVRAAYDDLVGKIDDAITRIGSDRIHAFDLPEAVRETKVGLPASLRPFMDQAIEDHEVTKFWTTMGLTFAQVLLVFIPVVGPVLAAGLGAGMLVSDVTDALNRLALSQASTNPEGDLLGVSGPGKFEWFMLAAQAALTAVDLGGAWAEMSAARPHFEVEPHEFPGEVSEHGAPVGEARAPDDINAITGDPQAHGAGAGDRATLEQSRNTIHGENLEPVQLNHELDAVADAPRRPSSVSGYEEEVELSNGHTWRRTREGNWCRFSESNPYCIVFSEGPTAHGWHIDEIPSQRLPTRGDWSGTEGNSFFTPSDPEVQQMMGYRPIRYRNGRPDFSPFREGNPVVLPQSQFGGATRGVHNTAADAIFARRQGWLRPNNQPDVARAAAYRQTNQLTWHHVPGEPGVTMELIPTPIHEWAQHQGGFAEL